MYWQPVAGCLWHIESTIPSMVLRGLGLSGWVLLLAATFEIDHFELFGLKQPWQAAQRSPTQKHVFQHRFLYRVVRHPIQLGVLMGMWLTPNMNASRFLFSATMTAYILIGLQFEERALVREFGDTYRNYKARVPMLLPFD